MESVVQETKQSIAVLFLILFAFPVMAQDKPNIVLVFMDNFGWGEPGFNGGGIVRGAATPRLDQLAAEGLRLTSFNVEVQCTPSRSAIMTGRYAVRSGNVDQAHRLSQLTGMASLFRSAIAFPSGGFYGVALLSRFPIISSSKLLLTSGSEQRILATVDVEIADGWLVPIAVTHMGLGAIER